MKWAVVEIKRKIYFWSIYWKGIMTQREGEAEKDILHLLAYYPNGCRSEPSWSQGPITPLWVKEIQILRSTSAAFSGALSRSRKAWNGTGILINDVGIICSGLTCCATTAPERKHFRNLLKLMKTMIVEKKMIKF